MRNALNYVKQVINDMELQFDSNKNFSVRMTIDEFLEGLTSPELIQLNEAIKEDLIKRGY